MTPSYPDPRGTKLVCTLGPATAGRVAELVAAGMDVARLNLSHGTADAHTRAVDEVRGAAAAAGRQVAILADLQGPKIRLGPLEADPVELRTGARFVLRASPGPGDADGASTTYPNLAGDVEPGDRILLADGAAELCVQRREGTDVVTEVIRGGQIRARAGVNVPSARLTIDAITSKDTTDLELALGWDVDYVAQSFVRRADDIERLRAMCGSRTRVVAKVETRPAVDDYDAICVAADAVMIARGDLGVEVAFQDLPLLQKELVRRGVAAARPVIVATQMLESMVTSPRPTRAEAGDIANAVLEGADAMMLSAETAIGEYPIEAARTACAVALAAERGTDPTHHGLAEPSSEPQAIARAAADLSRSDPRIAAIACYTASGHTARLLSAVRPPVPVFAFSADEGILRALSLARGVHPYVCERPGTIEDLITTLEDRLRRIAGLGAGSLVVLAASIPHGGDTNLLKLHRIGP